MMLMPSLALVALTFTPTPNSESTPGAPLQPKAIELAWQGDEATPHTDVAVRTEAAEVEPDNPFDHAANGIYPLWENNGHLLPHRRALIGSSNVLFGIGGVVQLGVAPTSLVMRTPNFQLKVPLYRDDRVLLAGQLGTYVLMPGADSAFASSRYTSRIYNPDHTIVVAPLSVAATIKVASWLQLHPSVTALGVFGSKVRSEVTPGAFVTAELLALENHSLLLHGGEIGMWDHDQYIFGASYRLNWQWLEARAGYFYRISPDGMQGQPLVSAGLLL